MIILSMRKISRYLIFSTFYKYFTDMSTWNNLYGGVYGNKSYQTYGNTKSYSIPNTDLITSGNTETITINTTFSKAIDAMMTKILKYITSQGVMDKKLICQGNTD